VLVERLVALLVTGGVKKSVSSGPKCSCKEEVKTGTATGCSNGSLKFTATLYEVESSVHPRTVCVKGSRGIASKEKSEAASESSITRGQFSSPTSSSHAFIFPFADAVGRGYPMSAVDTRFETCKVKIIYLYLAKAPPK